MAKPTPRIAALEHPQFRATRVWTVTIDGVQLVASSGRIRSFKTEAAALAAGRREVNHRRAVEAATRRESKLTLAELMGYKGDK